MAFESWSFRPPPGSTVLEATSQGCLVCLPGWVRPRRPPPVFPAVALGARGTLLQNAAPLPSQTLHSAVSSLSLWPCEVTESGPRARTRALRERSLCLPLAGEQPHSSRGLSFPPVEPAAWRGGGDQAIAHGHPFLSEERPGRARSSLSTHRHAPAGAGVGRRVPSSHLAVRTGAQVQTPPC